MQGNRLHFRVGARTRHGSRLRRPHRHRGRSQRPFDARSRRPNPRMNILIVRLGALGDIVHTVPAAAALREAFPQARIDWLVDAKHRDMIGLVTVVDHAIVLERSSIAGWMDVSRRMRAAGYDVAIDFQGLMKSAILARASGAPRVIGFSIWHLREKTARPFYSEIGRPGSGPPDVAEHVIHKNL